MRRKRKKRRRRIQRLREEENGARSWDVVGAQRKKADTKRSGGRGNKTKEFYPWLMWRRLRCWKDGGCR